MARLLAVLVPAALLAGAYSAQCGFGLFLADVLRQRYPHASLRSGSLALL